MGTKEAAIESARRTVAALLSEAERAGYVFGLIYQWERYDEFAEAEERWNGLRRAQWERLNPSEAAFQRRTSATGR